MLSPRRLRRELHVYDAELYGSDVVKVSGDFTGFVSVPTGHVAFEKAHTQPDAVRARVILTDTQKEVLSQGADPVAPNREPSVRRSR